MHNLKHFLGSKKDNNSSLLFCVCEPEPEVVQCRVSVWKDIDDDDNNNTINSRRDDDDGEEGDDDGPNVRNVKSVVCFRRPVLLLDRFSGVSCCGGCCLFRASARWVRLEGWR